MERVKGESDDSMTKASSLSLSHISMDRRPLPFGVKQE